MPDLMTIELHLGRAIRRRRQDLGMNQEGLARQIGVSYQMVSKYEVGRGTISAARLLQISRALDTQPASFFEGLEHG